jgi:hypothetical protein
MGSGKSKPKSPAILKTRGGSQLFSSGEDSFRRSIHGLDSLHTNNASTTAAKPEEEVPVLRVLTPSRSSRKG